MEKTALVVIDIQNDYFPGGKMELVGIEKAALTAKKLIDIFRTRELPVIFIQHISIRPGASFFVPDTFGAQIHESILPKKKETVIQKNYPNSFRDTQLHEILQTRNISELVFCGAMSHMCIDTSVRAAFDLGYSNIVISDACATRDLVFQEKIVSAEKVQLAYMAALNGTFATVTTLNHYMENTLGSK